MDRYPHHTPYVLCALEQPQTFNEIERNTKIPPSTLSKSLKILVKQDLIHARPLKATEEEKTSGMWKYELTKEGQALLPIAKDAIRIYKNLWGKIYSKK